jgi:DNA-binding winged helix-turn-helix (wHTH) protein
MPSVISSLYEFGEFRLDTQNRVLRRGEQTVALTPKTFELLLLLIQNGGEVISKDELMRSVWCDSYVEESNLTQTVFMLRKALGETPEQRYILTVQGRGYSLSQSDRCRKILLELPAHPADFGPRSRRLQEQFLCRTECIGGSSLELRFALSRLWPCSRI